MPIYNKFSEEYARIFEKNIEEFRNKYCLQKSDNKDFVTFYPAFGTKANVRCDFLFLGQAVNGWGTGLSSHEDWCDPISEVVKASNEYLMEKDHTPLDFVNVLWSKSTFNKYTSDPVIKSFYDENNKGIQYLFCRSFFWNVVYKTISDYYELDRSTWDWSRKLVWSNLYKIAPDGANPDSFEKELQQPISIELIKKEIEELKPKFCIVLTNSSWWLPFQKGLRTEAIPFSSELDQIEHFERYGQTSIIVTTRPFRGNNERHVQQILDLIKQSH